MKYFFLFFFLSPPPSPLARKSQGKLLFCLTWNKNIFSVFFPWFGKLCLSSGGCFTLPFQTSPILQREHFSVLPGALCQQSCVNSSSYWAQFLTWASELKADVILMLCKLCVTESFRPHRLGPQPPSELKELCWIDCSSQQADSKDWHGCLRQEAALGQPQPPCPVRMLLAFMSGSWKVDQRRSPLTRCPKLGLSSWELVLILIGLCPWVNPAMQGKICFSPLHLHPAEPRVSVELCSPAESRIV